MSSLSSVGAAAPLPAFEPVREVRLAVVMYGGGSLAIYINGVAQELLHLVRATAPDGSGKSPTIDSGALSPVERVYRELGQRLNGDSKGRHAAADPIRTRFVVDVLSGTSAGGINAIFLAKALANGQSLAPLTQLWIAKAEIGRLLNDGKGNGEPDPSLPFEEAPSALLSGHHTYDLLLEALTALDASSDGTSAHAERPHLVDELDLYVTATDLEGLPIPIQLADKRVTELRHRNVFRFQCQSERASSTGTRTQGVNDFEPGNNPFLAYAARCTSSLPFAFRPMELADIRECKSYHGTFASDLKGWQEFFHDYLHRSNSDSKEELESRLAFAGRAFGDGAYLDNKPFSYATATLRLRQPSVAVDRTLLYIEPSPEHPEVAPNPKRSANAGARDPGFESGRPGPRPRPNAFENSLLAVSALPRAESIRDDIQQVHDRNRLIERVRRVTRDLERDVRVAKFDAAGDPEAAEKSPRAWEPGDQWASKWLDQALSFYGAPYGGYHRLKVSEVTVHLATALSRALNLPAESADFHVVRYLLSAWRRAKYAAYKTVDEQGRAKLSEKRFLFDFDLDYRIRRLLFVLDRVDLLLDWERNRSRRAATGGIAGSGLKSAESQPAIEEQERTEEMLKIRLGARKTRDLMGWVDLGPSLREMKRKLGASLLVLRDAARSLESSREDNPLVPSPMPDASDARSRELRTNLRVFESLSGLRGILEGCSPEDCLEHAREALEERPDLSDALDQLTARVRAFVKDAKNAASREAKILLAPLDELTGEAKTKATADREGLKDEERHLRTFLWKLYANFERFDLVLFPIVFGTDVGETSEVEVFRVSPEDATRLISERDGASQLQCGKLAGTSLGSLGAFFSETSRHSDVLWGRLDGAERLIRVLCRGHHELVDGSGAGAGGNAHRGLDLEIDRLVGRAQYAILQEHFDGEPRIEHHRARRILVEALLHVPGDQPRPDLLTTMLSRLEPPPGLPRSARLDAILKPEKMLQAYESAFERDRELDHQKALQVLARATQITGRVIDHVASVPKRARQPFVRILAYTGGILWGLAEVAVPRSWGSLLLDYWLRLLYPLEVLLIFGGFALKSPDARKVGFALLAVTIVANIAYKLARSWVRSKRTRPWVSRLTGILAGLAALLLTLLAILGWIYLPRWVQEQAPAFLTKWWPRKG